MKSQLNFLINETLSHLKLSIACVPFFNSNISSKLFFSSIGSDILCLARNTLMIVLHSNAS